MQTSLSPTSGLRWVRKAEKEARKKAFQGYQINDEAAWHAAKPGCHGTALPAGTPRARRSPTKVFEAHASEIFEEAENRLHAQKAVMVTLMGSIEE